ncbi:collagen alpha-1(I) chain-like isoform X5 [Prionailurus bengalensis]|uniref:collagen alpha-1(I) chain-like isoform X5 n=1 Tax=Prionailurus bengalensis TaxID=37029 RepID=UPI001CA9435D|nr:collagen alpha-1(I) chain-like isoform X5 [Prionailurus bengalensis]
MSENSLPSFSSKLRSSTLPAPGKVQWPRQARGRPREEGLPGPRVPVVCGTAGRSVARNGHLADGSVRTHSLEKLNKMSENSLPSFSSKLRSSTLPAPGKVQWPRQARGRPREEGLPGPRVPVVCGTAGRSVARNGHLADGSVRTHSLEKLNKMSENSLPSFSSKLRSSTLPAPGKVQWPRQARGRPREEGLPGPRVPVVCGTAGRSVARNGHLADGSVRTVQWPRQARGRPREEGLPGPRVPVVCGTAGRSVARNGHLADGSVRTHSLEKLNKMSENSLPSFSSKLRSSTLPAPGKVQWPRQARGRPREEGLPGPRVPVVCGTAGRSVARNGHLADGSVRTHSLEKLNKMSENSLPSFSSKLRSSTLPAPGKVQWPRQARGRPREEGLPGPRVPVVCGTAGRSVARNGHLADGSVRTHSLEKLNKMSENSLPSFSSKLRSSTLPAPGKVQWPRQARGRPREEGLPGPRVPVVCGTAGRSVARNGHLADGSVRTHSLEKLNKMSENSLPSFSSKLRSSTLPAPGKVSVRDSRLPIGRTASSTSTHGLRLGEARGVSPGQGAVSPP